MGGDSAGAARRTRSHHRSRCSHPLIRSASAGAGPTSAPIAMTSAPTGTGAASSGTGRRSERSTRSIESHVAAARITSGGFVQIPFRCGMTPLFSHDNHTEIAGGCSCCDRNGGIPRQGRRSCGSRAWRLGHAPWKYRYTAPRFYAQHRPDLGAAIAGAFAGAALQLIPRATEALMASCHQERRRRLLSRHNRMVRTEQRCSGRY